MRAIFSAAACYLPLSPCHDMCGVSCRAGTGSVDSSPGRRRRRHCGLLRPRPLREPLPRFYDPVATRTPHPPRCRMPKTDQSVARVLVTKPMLGICHMQVCTVADASDEEILRVANRENPVGTERGWCDVIRLPTPVRPARWRSRDECRRAHPTRPDARGAV